MMELVGLDALRGTRKWLAHQRSVYLAKPTARTVHKELDVLSVTMDTTKMRVMDAKSVLKGVLPVRVLLNA